MQLQSPNQSPVTPPTYDGPFSPEVALCLSYLAYSGSSIPRNLFLNPDLRILHIIEDTIPKIAPLCVNEEKGTAEWKTVWGPATYTFPHGIYEDNAMVVLQNTTRPTDYAIAIRGTNGTAVLDWIEEDLRVFRQEDWQTPIENMGVPKVSESTKIGMNILLSELEPDIDTPGEGLTLIEFLTQQTADQAINLLFTGHSLGGALTTTLALWFRQFQNIAGHWDPNGNATIWTISFAAPTAGNDDFAKLSDKLLGNKCLRYHNSLDIVTHGWNKETLAAVRGIYQSGGIEMSKVENLFLDGLLLLLNDYQQIESGQTLTWDIQTGEQYQGFFEQAGTQHFDSYPALFNQPELTTIIQRL